MKIESIEQSPLAKGKNHLLSHMQGKLITRSQAMAAKCYECMGGYKDGKADCGISDCPLYPWMPFLVAGPRINKRMARSTAFGCNKVAVNT